MRAIFFSFLFGFSVLGLNAVPQTKVVNISAVEFQKKITSNPGIILDVRTPQETAQGHIPEASFINYYDNDFARKVNLMQKDKPIYVYCRSGGRSAKAAQILQQNGFKEIYNLVGGIGAWSSASLPITKNAQNTSTSKTALSEDDFNKILQSNKVVLVDFYTEWCSPCKKMAPIISSLSTEFKDNAKVLKIDVDKSKRIAQNENVKGVPVLCIYKNGKEVWRHSGTISEEELRKILLKYV